MECFPLAAGSGSGLVVGWEQETGILLASGDVRFIRVWDTQREMRMQVTPGENNAFMTLAITEQFFNSIFNLTLN